MTPPMAVGLNGGDGAGQGSATWGSTAASGCPDLPLWLLITSAKKNDKESTNVYKHSYNHACRVFCSLWLFHKIIA